MNTPAHLIFGAAVFARPGQGRVTWAAVIGGLLPDIPLMLMVGWSLWVAQIPVQTVFGQLYFSDGWQRVFAIDHSLLLWGAALTAGVLMARRVLTAFAGSGFLHAALDFLLHHDDARAQLWPLTWWKFRSPVSYWDRAYYGHIFGPVETGVSLLLCLLLWRRFSGWKARGLILAVAGAEMLPGLMFTLMLH